MNAPSDPRRIRPAWRYVKDAGPSAPADADLAALLHQTASTPAGSREAATGYSAAIFPALSFDAVQLATWNYVVPRLYASYDVSGDGKTVVKGGYGRFGHNRDIADLTPYDPNTVRYGVYLWHDLNANNDYDAGETNQDPSGPDFVETAASEFGPLPPKFVPNPNEKMVTYDEYSVNLERELMANLSVRVTGSTPERTTSRRT